MLAALARVPTEPLVALTQLECRCVEGKAPDLVSPACIVKIEMLAQRTAQRCAISVDLAGELATNETDRFGPPQDSFDLVLLVHLCRISRMTTIVQVYLRVGGRASGLTCCGRQTGQRPSRSPADRCLFEIYRN